MYRIVFFAANGKRVVMQMDNLAEVVAHLHLPVNCMALVEYEDFRPDAYDRAIAVHGRGIDHLAAISPTASERRTPRSRMLAINLRRKGLMQGWPWALPTP